MNLVNIGDLSGDGTEGHLSDPTVNIIVKGNEFLTFRNSYLLESSSSTVSYSYHLVFNLI